ncbi:MAG: hypothetical protein ACE14O_02765 [Candidatus Cloacimonadaceae bacterium]
MVQRTGLVVTLLLLCLLCSLQAQSSGNFTPPHLISQPVLDIPIDWPNEYSPAEVMILVEIKADSTASLVRILDGKTELQPLIENLLPYLIFIPATQDGKPINANLSLKLTIRREGAPVPGKGTLQPGTLTEEDKKYIYNLINRYREKDNLQNIFSSSETADSTFAPQNYSSFYRSNYFMLGLNNYPYLIMKDGFIQPARIYYNALQFQMLSAFRDVSFDHAVASFANEKYLSPVMLTDVTAGLGDYEYNFARVLLRKNGLFGKNDFYAEAGLLAQNGWWQETVCEQTSMRLFLSLPVRNTTLSFNWEKYNQDIPSPELLTGFSGSQIFSLSQELDDIYLKWQLPWFTLGWNSQCEKLHKKNYINRQNFRTDQLLLTASHEFAPANLDLTYQYNYHQDLPSAQSLYQYNTEAKHHALLKAEKQIKTFAYQSQLAFTEDGFDLGSLEAGLIRKQRSFSLIYTNYNGKHSALSDSLFYTNSAVLTYPSVYLNQSQALRYRFNPARGKIKFDLYFGNKVIKYKSQSPSAELSNLDKNSLYSESLIQLKHEFGRYLAFYEQTCEWNQYQKDLPELPEVQYQSRFKLERDLNYNNRLSAGINLTGHTDYHLADARQTTVFGALVADAWLAVKITDLFEFQVELSNLGDNIIYGVYTHPRTLLANVHWFYLN